MESIMCTLLNLIYRLSVRTSLIDCLRRESSRDTGSSGASLPFKFILL